MNFSNAAILYYKEEIVEFFLKNDEYHAKYLLYLFENEKITVDQWLDSQKFDLKKTQEENEFNYYVTQFTTQFFVDFLRNLNKIKTINLISKLENFKQVFIDKLKISYRKKYCHSTIIPFDEDGQNFSIKQILLETKYRKFNENYSDQELSLKDNQFLKTIEKINNRFLFIGNAGSGKSCHFRKIICDWCEKKDFLENYILFALNLKEITMEDFEKEIYFQIFDTEPNSNDLSILRQIIQTCNRSIDTKENVIFLLDGADECSTTCPKIIDILNGNFEMDYPTIVWSREWKAKQIKRSYDKVYKIEEFTENDILNYFQIFFKYEKPKNLCDVNSRLDPSIALFNFLRNEKRKIFKHCSNPFISLLSAILWNNDKKDAFNDIFDLYSFAVDTFLEKKINDDTKTEVIEECCKIAYKNLLFENDIEKTELLSKCEFAGGLLTSSCSYYNWKRKKRIEKLKFIHTSFQEYFTACFILKSPENRRILHEDLNNFSDNNRNMTYIDRYFKLSIVLNLFKDSYKQIFDTIKSNDNIINILETNLSNNLIQLIQNGPENGILRLSTDYIPNEIISYLIRAYGNSLKVIIFRFVEFDVNYFFRLILENSIEIQKLVLEFYYTKITDNDYLKKLFKLHSIEILEISGIHFFDESENDNFDYEKNENLKQLTFNNSLLPKRTPFLPNLIKLDLNGSDIGKLFFFFHFNP